MAATHTTKCRLYIDWSRTGVFVEETTRLVSASGTWRRNNPEDSITSPKGIVSQATITLINHDARFSTINDAGPLSTYIENGGYYQAPMYITIDEDGDENRIFTGVIKGPQEVGGSIDQIGQITFDCRSREELLLQQKNSTTYANVQAYHDSGISEAGFILEWLTLAGIDSGDFTHDAGVFVLPWAWLDNESPLEDIWQLAAAGGGAFYTNPDGQFIYEAMTGWVDDLESTTYEAFTDDDYRRGSVKINDDELYQTITVEVTSRDIAGTAVVWDSPEQVSIPADSTGAVGHGPLKEVTALLQQPLYQIDSVLYDASSAGGLAMTDFVSWTPTYYAQRIIFSFTNTSTGHAAQLRGFKITGKSLIGGPSSEVSQTSDEDFWELRSGRTRTLSNNYIQTQAQAESLAKFLIDRHQLPRVFYTLTDCPGKTSRYLSMRIVIRAGKLVSSDRPALITGISWRFSKEGGFVQTIEAFDCFNLFDYSPTDTANVGLKSTANYFRVGTTGHTLNSTKRLFY